MKALFFKSAVAAAMACALVLCSCERDDKEDQNNGQKLEKVGKVADLGSPDFTGFASGTLAQFGNRYAEIGSRLDQLMTERTEVINIRRNGEDDGENSLKAYMGIGGIRSTAMNYTSVDGYGKPVTLSARIYWPYDRKTGKNIEPDNIVISCHATAFDNTGAPSLQSKSDFGNLAIDGNLVIEPDYIGFGETSSMIQTYLCQNLIARNCFDALLAGIEAADGNKIPKLKKGYGTYVTGYSQGGGNALALTRYIETKASESDKTKINLIRSFVGSGPYNPELTFQCWLKDGQMTMPSLLAMVLQGFQSGGKSQFENFDLRQYFSDRFLSSGLLEALANKTLDMMSVVNVLKDYMPDAVHSTDKSILAYYDLDAIMSETAKNPNSDCMVRLHQGLEEENQLADGWTPKHPITFFYTSGDDMVPPENTYAAIEKFGNTGLVKKVDCGINQHIVAQLIYSLYAVALDGYRSDDNIVEIKDGMIISIINELISNFNM